jgi:glutathione gamma-glutamylcysteinyltransferase
VRERGLDLDELGCLARCNGADVALSRADAGGLDAWRSAVRDAASGNTVLIAAYDRKLLDQTGSGHFSPIGGHHAARDLVLVLDVARFKYPPHWVAAEKLFAAMQSHDPTTGKSRGWLALRARPHGLALGFSLRCDEAAGGWRDMADRFNAARAELAAAESLEPAIRALLPLGARLELRTPTAPAHRDVLSRARAAIRGLEPYQQVSQVVGEESAEMVTLLLVALVDSLGEVQRARFEASIAALATDEPLRAEIANLRAQMTAVANTPLGRGLL